MRTTKQLASRNVSIAGPIVAQVDPAAAEETRAAPAKRSADAGAGLPDRFHEAAAEIFLRSPRMPHTADAEHSAQAVLAALTGHAEAD